MSREEQIGGIEWIAALRALARRMRRAGYRVWGDEVDRLATALHDGRVDASWFARARQREAYEEEARDVAPENS